ncbi:MAG TPA: AMP-binding protein [Bacteroidota bacterium]|nr:AMP-binding protein [Bacteroidota bacterium]
MLLHEYLSRSARLTPDKVALVCGAARSTYKEIATAASSFAGFLVASGLRKGERVAIYIDSSPQTVIAIFGALEAGGCIVVINPATQAERLGYILENCNARFLVCSVEKRAQVQQASAACTAKPLLVWTGAGEEAEAGVAFSNVMQEARPSPHVRLIDNDLAGIVYTSGSTGKPKGVTHLHRTFNTAVEAIAEYLENNAEDVILGVLPLSSSYGLLQLLVTFWTGGRVVLEKGFGYPYEIIKRIKEEKVTGLAGAPTIWAIILRLEGLEKEDFSSLRYITNAAAAMPASFVPRLRKVFPATKIFLMHGLTECLRTTYLPPDEIETRTTSVGTGMRNIELWVEDADGVRLGPGHVGEMIVRGSTLMVGYWNDPEGTAKALIPGPMPGEKVLRTRDLFRMDEEGYFHFVARSDELIKSRGEKVSPIEVEDVIYTLDAVNEVRVIGVPDTILGQAIRAEIVLKEGRTVSAQEVKAHCRRFLEDFKVPGVVEFVASLPKTQGGKIKRSA